MVILCWIVWGDFRHVCEASTLLWLKGIVLLIKLLAIDVFSGS